MSRQRLRESNVKWTIKLTNESFALKILKLIEIKTIENNAKIIELQINKKISDFIEKNFKEDVNYFENKNKVKISIAADNELDLSEYTVQYKSKSKKIIEKEENLQILKKDLVENNIKNKKIKKIFKKNKFIKKFSKKKN